MDFFAVGNEIYKCKYFGNNLCADKSRIYTIKSIQHYSSYSGVHVMGSLDNGEQYELMFYNTKHKTYKMHAEHIHYYTWCCF